MKVLITQLLITIYLDAHPQLLRELMLCLDAVSRRSELESANSVSACFQPHTVMISQRVVNGAWRVVSRVLRLDRRAR